MTAGVALKLVKTQSFYRKDLGALYSESGKQQGESHSLHSLVNFGNRIDPDLAGVLIDNFTETGQVILDPFCGIGTIAVEAALKGRIPVVSDINRLKLSVAHALLTPVDISEITLALQFIPFTRLVDTGLHNKNFEPFYDIRTFCELLNLRSALKGDRSKAATFIKAVTLGLLHGQSSGSFSAYSPAHIALAPEEQWELNQKRRQVPDYRPVLPRILRKTAAVLRDGIPTAMKKAVVQGAMQLADSRNLSFVPSASIDCVMTIPPRGNAAFRVDQLWLELWFLDIAKSSVLAGDLPAGEDSLLADGAASFQEAEWLEFMNASLFEQARVLKPGGRSILIAADVDSALGSARQPAEMLLELVERDLNRYFEPEAMLIQEANQELLGDSRKPLARSGERKRILILRRR